MFPRYILHRSSSFHMFATSCTVILAQPFFHVNPFFSIVFLISYFYNLKYLQEFLLYFLLS